MRDAPCELPRWWPGSNRSRRTTSDPRRASHHAVAEPIAPPPTTTASARLTGAGSLQPARPAGDDVDDEQQDDRSHCGDAQAGQVEVELAEHTAEAELVDPLVGDGDPDDAADQRSEPADDDVPEAAAAGRGHDGRRDPAGQPTDDDPADQAHDSPTPVEGTRVAMWRRGGSPPRERR